MSYAIIRTGGKQFRAEPGKSLRIPSLLGDAGTVVEFNDVLIGSNLANTMDGGLGEDTVDYSKSIGGVTLNLQTNAVTGAGGTDRLSWHR